MKKLIILLGALLLVSCSRVEPGYVGVKVNLLGGSKGVNSEVLGVGKYWIGMNERLYLFPTFQQNYVWTQDRKEGSPNDESIKFQTKEGMEVGADFGISYHVDRAKVSTLFQKYRRGINEITDVYLRNHVRAAVNKVASTMKVDSVYGEGKSRLIRDVKAMVSNKVAPIGIIVDEIYLIGSLRLPTSVVNSLNRKVQSTQKALRIQNEVAEERAKGAKRVAIARAKEAEEVANAKARYVRARSIAASNRVIAASLTKSFVELERIKKWNGERSQVVGSNTIIKGL